MSAVAAPTRARLLRITSVVLLVLTGALLLAPMLAYPFGSDHGSFATAADVLGRGGHLYRDVFEIKPPGVYYLFLLAFRLFGHSMVAVRILDLLWTLAAAYVLVLVGWRLSTRAAGLVGAFAFLALYALGVEKTQAFWHTAQCDGFTSLPLALAMLLALQAEERREWRRAAGAGALVGAAIILKFTIGGLLALPVLLALAARKEPAGARVGRVGAYLLGCAAVLGVTTLFLWRTGSLRDMIEIVFRWNAYYGQIRGGPALPHLIDFLFGGQYLILQVIGALALTGVVQLLMERRWRLRDWLVPLWAAMMFAGVVAQGKYFAYHWLPLLPPMGLLAGQGLLFALDRLGRAFSAKERKALTVGLVGAVVAVLGWGYAVQFQRPLEYAAGRLSPQDYTAGFVTPGGYFSLAADEAVAEYVEQHTAADDRLFVWGLEPLVYFLADRRPASRFMHAIPLLTPWSPPEWRVQAIADIERTRPKLILVVHNDSQPWTTGWMGDSYSALVMTFPELRAVLEREYRPAAKIEDFDVWERR